MVQPTVIRRANNEAAKRRAPYALRACEACRRRKGKCDGRQPCRYCTNRGQSCKYNTSLTSSDDWQAPAGADADQVDATQDSRGGSTSSARWNPETIASMLCSLQEQLDSLNSRIQTPSLNLLPPQSPNEAAPEDNHDENFMATFTNDVDSSSQGGADVASKPLGKAASPHFVGPTSPDYSLNVAQIKLSGPSLQHQQPRLAFIHQDTVDQQDPPSEEDALHPTDDVDVFDTSSAHSDKDHAKLLQFRSVIGLQETLRLLHVYQEVIGELHPIVDIDELASQAPSCYEESDSGICDLFNRGPCEVSEEQLLILNLILAIALRADSNTASHHTGILLRQSFQDIVNAKLATPAYSLNHVIIILLKGWYDYFNDSPQSAWRLCGIAGRMVMELGFHNGEVFKHLLDSESQRSEAYTLISTIVVLDRQWSASTGLPTHFHESRFNPVPATYTINPYLKAMLSFILISDKFSEPISKVAKGERYNDYDAFELMNFQIEQWRKNAVGENSLTQVETWSTDPSSRPPTWTILLNLRAESVRSLLMRPFFFSDADPEATRQHIRPATDLVYTVVHVLYTIDNTTNIYRQQHPCCQHLLASISALAFLLIAYIEQNQSTLMPTLTPDLVSSLSHSFEMAVALTTSYVGISKAARRLDKRLSVMRKILTTLGILDGVPTVEKVMPGRAKEKVAHLTNPAARTTHKKTRLGQSATQGTQLNLEFNAAPFFQDRIPDTGGFGNDMLPIMSDAEFSSGWIDALRLQCQNGDLSHMFSEGNAF
ncbi:unnamed protein product [Clonostachys rhizophaga]|uniref:Zn(2)-C6 fungal-type domain-containing protein n=1 Tax=Clonostachys rhizophaga TaxID=160324 RepID=A0A9N9VX15_9HYPO|nr:unnamed protein product [Clonostachys rhizophaga]